MKFEFKIQNLKN